MGEVIQMIEEKSNISSMLFREVSRKERSQKVLSKTQFSKSLSECKENVIIAEIQKLLLTKCPRSVPLLGAV